MLFTGDIEAKTENDLVSRYGKKLQSTVLKVAHHEAVRLPLIIFLKSGTATAGTDKLWR